MEINSIKVRGTPMRAKFRSRERYVLERRKEEMRVVEAMMRMDNGPASHPSCPMLHARDSTPELITPVTMCATAVHTIPITLIHSSQHHSHVHVHVSSPNIKN